MAEEEDVEDFREFEDVAHNGRHGDRLINIESSVVKRRMNLFLEVKNCKDVRRDEVNRFLAKCAATRRATPSTRPCSFH